MLPYNKKLVSNARTLRKNMTREEKHLWYDFLKKLPINVHRQHNIKDYIVDFYIAEKKIVIEVDGLQHSNIEHVASDTRLRIGKIGNYGFEIFKHRHKQEFWRSYRRYFKKSRFIICGFKLT